MFFQPLQYKVSQFDLPPSLSLSLSLSLSYTHTHPSQSQIEKRIGLILIIPLSKGIRMNFLLALFDAALFDPNQLGPTVERNKACPGLKDHSLLLPLKFGLFNCPFPLCHTLICVNKDSPFQSV